MTDRPEAGYIAIVDLGSQYAHLIYKRLTYLGVRSVLADWFTEEVYRASAVVVSGSPMSALRDDVREIEEHVRVFIDNGKPLLGICFGHQVLASVLGGRLTVRPEYGRTKVLIHRKNEVLGDFNYEEVVWMSHSDCVVDTGAASVDAISENGCVAALSLPGRKVFGVQFHPEVSHTPKGTSVFRGFIRAAGLDINEITVKDRVTSYYPQALSYLQSSYRGGKVVSAVSGGVDSTVATYLAIKAIGKDNVIPVLIDHGLLREGEADEVLNNIKKVGIEPIYIDASYEFLSRLEGVESCEERRKIIGELYAKELSRIIEEVGAKYLLQGTTFPDVIESGRTRHSRRIKSHHNVGGLPQINVEVLEPLKGLYKDEVRELGRQLGLPEEIVSRHPFPGPGLAVRVIGRFTREKLELLRRADRIVTEELISAGIYDRLWQSVVTISESWVGIKGDERDEGYMVNVRLVTSEDGMTADYVLPSPEVVDRISRRITNEVNRITAVSFVTSTKPPATIEPC